MSWIFGGPPTSRCVHCASDNDLGVKFCIFCGTAIDGITCPLCETINESDARGCETCGHFFAVDEESDPILESIAPRAPVPVPAGPSPLVLIGFGAVVSMAAATHPWYLLGVDRIEPATLSQLLDVGWEGFPGTPLTLIVISALTSTTVSMVRSLDTVRAGVAVAAGFVTLLSATQLWEGFARIQSGTTDAPLPVTGAVLATIGAIVMIAAGLYLWSFQRARPAWRATALLGSPAGAPL